MIRLLLKPLRLFILLAIAVLIFVPKAEARGSLPYGWDEQLSFVASSEIPAPSGGMMTLCHMTTKYHLAYLGFWRSSNGYVLSESQCAGEGIYEIDAEGVSEAKSAGLLGRMVPIHPRMSLTDFASGFAGLGLVALLALGLGVRQVMRRRQLMIRKEILGIQDPAVFAFIDAMCHAARADDHTAEEEVEYILGVARDLTGLDYNAMHIQAAIHHCPRLGSADDMKHFGAGLSLHQRQLIFQGALTVIAADGAIDRSEKRFLNAMAKGMGLAAEHVDGVITRTFGQATSPTDASPA